MNRYKKAYSIINNITPLKKDCGSLCSKSCCKSDENRGMLLFPGEEKSFLKTNSDWYKIQDTEIVLSNNKRIKLFICEASCTREERPLACRIFPFMPYITDDGILEIRLDPKSINTCPLAYDVDKHMVQEEFIDALYDAFEQLIIYDDVIEFINILSDDYDKISDLI